MQRGESNDRSPRFASTAAAAKCCCAVLAGQARPGIRRNSIWIFLVPVLIHVSAVARLVFFLLLLGVITAWHCIEKHVDRTRDWREIIRSLIHLMTPLITIIPVSSGPGFSSRWVIGRSLGMQPPPRFVVRVLIYMRFTTWGIHLFARQHLGYDWFVFRAEQSTAGNLYPVSKCQWRRYEL